MIKRYGIEGELIYQKDDGHIVRYEDYEVLQHKFGGVSSLCEEAMRINCEWEKAMMSAIGEDGIGSVTKAIEQLKADKHALQQKLDAMADKLARSEDYSVGVDAERMEYIKKCNAMAAESAALKDLQPTQQMITAAHRELEEYDNIQIDDDAVVFTWQAMRGQQKTPATDAYLNSVRAEGVEMFALCMAEEAIKDEDEYHDKSTASNLASSYAEAMRSGTHDTVDKAG